MTATMRSRWEAAWERSDEILGMLAPDALYARPIPLRHPFIFYLGHLPAFAWNHACRGVLGLAAFAPRFDELFERGIDPPDTGAGAPPEDPPDRWPDPDAIVAYRERVRDALRSALPELDALADAHPMTRDACVQHVVLEHELMHHETLLYMLQELEPSRKHVPAGPPAAVGGAARGRRPVPVPGGEVPLGARAGSGRFGWDNEFPEHVVPVEDFLIDDLPVTIGEFLGFVADGGYARSELWSASGQAWRAARRARRPHGWRGAGDGLRVRTLGAERPLADARDLPASVTWAEADAFARWEGRRLPTEAEFHRAAYGRAEGAPAPWPWGASAPEPRHANLGLTAWGPTPVGARPGGVSSFGLHELVGNGWEWTATRFAPYPGFRATLPGYPGYSADFFDGRHYVLLGASWATDRALVRRSFRNWYQPHYPYPFTKFRCVGTPGEACRP
jgi:ergothioneine biosynthesis protein EgtB